MIKPHKIAVIFAWIILFTVFLMMGWFLYDSFWPPVLVKFNDGMIPIARDFTKCETPIHTFKPGDIVPLRIRGQKFTNDIPEIQTRLINDSVITLPLVYTSRDIGPFDFVSLSRKIPYGVHEGLFFFEITYIYHRNLIRSSETYKIRSEPFKVEVPKSAYDPVKDEKLLHKILRELSAKNKKEWEEFEKQKDQFKKDREEFEKTKHGK